MRILTILICLALTGPPALARAEEHSSTDAEFTGEFHRLCPRDARTEDDAERAFVAAGAKPARTLGALEVQHPAPADFPAGSEVVSAKRHWFYSGPRWVGIATTRTAAVGNARELHCKVQMSTADGKAFVWLLQYASGAAPKEHVFADGSHAYVFQDAATPNAYYLFWHDLPPVLPTAKPTSVLEYVTSDGPPRQAPFQTPEALALSRIERFCWTPAPERVAAKVAESGVGENDSEAVGRMTRPSADVSYGQAHAWTMNDVDQWKLQTRSAVMKGDDFQECTVRIAGLREQRLLDLLAKDKRLELEGDGPYQGSQARRYRLGGNTVLIYFMSSEVDGPLKSHQLTLIAGGPLVIRPVRR